VGVVAVTGATGFLGRHLVRALANDGWKPRVLVRRDPIHPLWRDIEIEVVTGDLKTPGALDRLCQGAEVVIHVAGLIKAASLDGFNAVNRDGARAAAQAAKAAGARFILVSSLAAREPQLSNYAASKRAGEDAVREISPERPDRPPASDLWPWRHRDPRPVQDRGQKSDPASALPVHPDRHDPRPGRRRQARRLLPQTDSRPCGAFGCAARRIHLGGNHEWRGGRHGR
jgi:hypothetical protein